MNKTKLIKYIKQNAIVNLYQHPEHIPIKGNCSAIDDEVVICDMVTAQQVKENLLRQR